jgi:hypothetical protein
LLSSECWELLSDQAELEEDEEEEEDAAVASARLYGALWRVKGDP